MLTQSRQILIVEDSPEDREIYRHYLQENTKTAYTFSEMATGEKGLESSRENPPDCILLDYRLPDMDGLEFLNELQDKTKGHTSSIPVIIMTGYGDEKIAVEAMKRGASDYLSKDDLKPEALQRAIANALQKAELQYKLEEQQEELERQRQELARKNQELENLTTRLSGILESITDGFFALDNEGCFTYFNQKTLQLLGQTSEELFGKNVREILPDLVGRASFQELRKTVTANLKSEFEVFLPKINCWLVVRVYPATFDQTHGYSVYFSDITARKQSEEALRKWASVFEHAQWGIAIANLDKTFELVNPAFAQMHGYEVEELIGKPISHVLAHHVKGELPEMFRSVQKQGHGLFEMTDLRKDNTTFSVILNVTDVKDEADKVLYQVASIQDITWIKQVEEQLRASEQFHRTLIENSPDIISRIDPQLRYLYSNRELKLTPGIIVPDDRSKPYYTVRDLGLPEDFYQVCENKIREVFQTRQKVMVEYSLSMPTGLAHYQTQLVPEFSSEGAVESILSISREITELKQAQLALQASEARLQAILNNAPIAIYLRDLEGRYLFVNQWAKTRTGLGEEASEGQSVYELFPEGNRDEWWANDRKVLEAGVALEFEETTSHRQGSRHYLSLKFPLFDLNGQPYAICGISTDISERKRVEEERLRLHEAERLARERAERANNHLALLSELSVALTSGLDYETITAVLARVLLPKLADWCVITLAEDDDQFKRFVAIRRDLAKEALLKEEAIRFPIPPKHVLQVLETGQPLILPEISDSFLEIISHNTEHLQLLRAIEPRSGMDVPLTVRNKTIGTIGFLSSKPNYYESGDLNLAQEIARRIALAIHNTRLYQQSQVLGQTQAELNQLKDLYMSVASHELRTPLTVARGYVQLLQRNLLRQSPNPNTSVDRSVDRTVGELASPTLPKPNSQNLTMLETILYQLDRMNGLISTLYNFSSIQNGKLELNYEQGADLLALIQRVVEQQQQANTSYVLAIQTSEKTVSGSYDEARLEQVLTNLVGNAIKYSPSGSTVTVGIACKQTPTKAGLEALLWVRDQGYGINPEDQAHIFEPFYRVRTQQTSRVVGLGLGLYISYQIVVQHKGRMWLESQVGEGTTFYFTLPLG